MSSNIILNQSNITNKNNNRLQYEFPSMVDFKIGSEIALSHLNVFYSWFNISVQNNNNFFQYSWWDDSGVLVPYDVLIPDGYYSLNTLHEFFQSIMIKNSHFLKTASGSHIYFIELLTNSTYYSVEIRLSSLQNELNINGENYNITTSSEIWKAGSWLPPSTYQTPQILIPIHNNFGALIGFNGGFPIYQDTTNDQLIMQQYSFLNDYVPQMEPSSSFIITCNLVNNVFARPSNVLNAFTVPNNVSFGDLITPINDIIYSKINPGQYKTIDLVIYDQDFRELKIMDSTMLLTLSIRNN